MVKVLSLGGSVIVPDNINEKFLALLRKLLMEYSKKEKIVIVCGGGGTSRKYMTVLEKSGATKKIIAYIGIRVTRLNAWFLINFFNGNCAKRLAKSLREVKSFLKKNRIVIIGSLHYKYKQTSDGTAAYIAHMLHTDFINITNVAGLYDRNPQRKNARLIPEISFDDFYKKIKKIKYKPGLHFILDHEAAKIIKKYNIKTYIVGPNIKNLKNVLEKKKFRGTLIR